MGKPKVAYRETITSKTMVNHKHVKQTGGKGQYAHVKLELYPTEPGHGFEFNNKITGGAVPREYIPSVKKGVIEVMQRGIFAGFPVVDVRVDLVDGSSHDVDSSEMAFKICAAACFKQAFLKGAPVLLEPYMSLEVSGPEESTGDIVGDICSRRGKILGMEMKAKQQVVEAETPLSEMFGYASALRSITSGRANYSMHFEKYVEVPFSISEKIVEEKKQVQSK